MFNKILKDIQLRRGIKSKEIAQIAGMSPQHWSEFRSGKVDLTARAMWRAIEAMDTISPGAKAEFAAEISDISIENVIAQMDSTDLSNLLSLIAKKLREPEKNCKSTASKKELSLL
jgi:transcriptional regulator with XRE-family HTH domain